MTYARTLFFRSLGLLVGPAIGLTAGLSQLSAVAQNAEAPEVESLMLPLELSLGALAILEPGASEGIYRLRFDGTRLSGGEWQLEALDAPHYAIRFVPDAEGALYLISEDGEDPAENARTKVDGLAFDGVWDAEAQRFDEIRLSLDAYRSETKNSYEEVIDYNGLETELVLEDDALSFRLAYDSQRFGSPFPYETVRVSPLEVTVSLDQASRPIVDQVGMLVLSLLGSTSLLEEMLYIEEMLYGEAFLGTNDLLAEILTQNADMQLAVRLVGDGMSIGTPEALDTYVELGAFDVALDWQGAGTPVMLSAEIDGSKMQDFIKDLALGSAQISAEIPTASFDLFSESREALLALDSDATDYDAQQKRHVADMLTALVTNSAAPRFEARVEDIKRSELLDEYHIDYRGGEGDDLVAGMTLDTFTSDTLQVTAAADEAGKYVFAVTLDAPSYQDLYLDISGELDRVLWETKLSGNASDWLGLIVTDSLFPAGIELSDVIALFQTSLPTIFSSAIESELHAEGLNYRYTEAQGAYEARAEALHFGLVYGTLDANTQGRIRMGAEDLAVNVPSQGLEFTLGGARVELQGNYGDIPQVLELATPLLDQLAAYSAAVEADPSTPSPFETQDPAFADALVNTVAALLGEIRGLQDSWTIDDFAMSGAGVTASIDYAALGYGIDLHNPHDNFLLLMEGAEANSLFGGGSLDRLALRLSWTPGSDHGARLAELAELLRPHSEGEGEGEGEAMTYAPLANYFRPSDAVYDSEISIEGLETYGPVTMDVPLLRADDVSNWGDSALRGEGNLLRIEPLSFESMLLPIPQTLNALLPIESNLPYLTMLQPEAEAALQALAGSTRSGTLFNFPGYLEDWSLDAATPLLTLLLQANLADLQFSEGAFMRFGPLEVQFEGLLGSDASAFTEIVKGYSRILEAYTSGDTEALIDFYSSYFSDMGYRGELGIGISGIEALEASLAPLLEIPNEAQPAGAVIGILELIKFLAVPHPDGSEALYIELALDDEGTFINGLPLDAITGGMR
jgi:hypothetical protein